MAKVEYRGGIPELRKTGLTNAEAFPQYLHVFGVGITFKSHKIPYDSMIDVSLVPEGAKKKNYVLNIEYSSNGFTSCVVLTGKETSALYGSIQQWRRNATPSQPIQDATSPDDSTCSASTDNASEIERYFNLKEQGIITEEEFSAKKAQLLGI